MAEALPLATTAVRFVLGTLGDFAVKKAFELYGVSNEVELMRVELVLIEGFLEDVGANPNNESRVVEKWLIELRHVAENIGKVIETFKNKIPESRIKRIFKKPLKLNNISADIVQNTNILKRLYERSTQLGIAARAIATKDPIAPLSLTVTATNKSSNVVDPEVVGLDSGKDRILKELLLENISRRTVLSIVGVGGLGKTTLAQKVYNSFKLDGRFHCRAWILISQTFNKNMLNDILRKILYTIEPAMKSRDPPLEDEYLVMELQSCLRDKRYLIILDDVWSTDLWDGLKNALVDANNGSRVIITTRNIDVAIAADRHTDPYQLPYLTDDESVALLFKTALQRPGIQPQDYPAALKDVAQNLIKKCGGLPLALVALGGILTREEDTLSAWTRVYETMDWHDQDVEKKCMKVLTKSYIALPDDHCKQCFCYFGYFPEDYRFSARQVIRMWVAEKLIPEPRAGTLEDQAEKYLQELVKRCLVQVIGRKSANGYCKWFRVHDLLRDLAIHNAQEDVSRPNRVTLQRDNPINDDDMDSTNTHSLLCFGVDMLNFNYQGFKELRVLLFDDVNICTIDPSCFQNWLEGLVHLRYLGFRYCSGWYWHYSDVESGDGEGVDSESEGVEGESVDRKRVDVEGVDREGVDGEDIDGEDIDWDGVNCESVDGEGIDGEGVDSEGVNGEGVNGEGVDGEGVDWEGAEGEGFDGEGVDGEGIDGERVDSEGIDDERVEGEGVDGEDVDSEGVDGEWTDKECVDDESFDGDSIMTGNEDKALLRDISFSGWTSLETLDCTGTEEVFPNPSFWKISTLRHVIGPDLVISSEDDNPLNLSHLKNLQSLKGRVLNCIFPAVECNINLRTLKIWNSFGIHDNAKEGWQGLQALLSRTEHLVSLSLSSSIFGNHELPFLSIGTRRLPCHNKIQSLALHGKWARDDVCVLSVEMFPKYLVKLELKFSKLEEDPIPILEKLQNLRILHLLNVAYMGRKMICSAGGFPSLQRLKLCMLLYLSEWEIKEKAMPVLNYLKIQQCDDLHTLPELQNVASLQNLIMRDCSLVLLENLETEDRYKIAHIASVHVKRSFHG